MCRRLASDLPTGDDQELCTAILFCGSVRKLGSQAPPIRAPDNRRKGLISEPKICEDLSARFCQELNVEQAWDLKSSGFRSRTKISVQIGQKPIFGRFCQDSYQGFSLIIRGPVSLWRFPWALTLILEPKSYIVEWKRDRTKIKADDKHQYSYQQKYSPSQHHKRSHPHLDGLAIQHEAHCPGDKATQPGENEPGHCQAGGKSETGVQSGFCESIGGVAIICQGIRDGDSEGIIEF
ncbi:hypothetical protein B0H14DRAFT_2575361 [Mycena olivaceomarginata]|nr:hypothetical protein B0H14DRAFT_2575361 [Mycena olivaceomarginata]